MPLGVWNAFGAALQESRMTIQVGCHCYEGFIIENRRLDETFFILSALAHKEFE